MTRSALATLALVLAGLTAPALAQDKAQAARTERMGDMSNVRSIVMERGLTKEGAQCISCHVKTNPGIISDWRDSRHAHAGVSCLDCHQVPGDSPAALKDHTFVEKVSVSVLVSPAVCGRCHAVERKQFDESGHFRAYRQEIPKDDLHALVQRHEGRNHPELGNAPDEVGCMQCHGTKIKVDAKGKPTQDTWPNSGMGSIYPDGATGSCTTCHTRHLFSIAEARKPHACASCHLGPDHPDIEVYENSKHGQLFYTEGHTWKWTTAPDAWEPGDYRGPTCATCHMSGIGELATTHNVTKRLYWNLWATMSSVRNSKDVMSPLLGDGEAGRKEMKQVCIACHSRTHTDNFFQQGDKAVKLYNEAYWKPAQKMHAELKEKGLLTENPWIDEFQITYYHLWHHEGRRARHGAMMGAPDWAHWHGFFELQQDLYKLEEIYKQRLKTGKIEPRS